MTRLADKFFTPTVISPKKPAALPLPPILAFFPNSGNTGFTGQILPFFQNSGFSDKRVSIFPVTLDLRERKIRNSRNLFFSVRK